MIKITRYNNYSTLGVGKTTVAGLYARILVDLGLLSKGEVILKNSSDFIGSALGTSEANTRGILASAEGSVLVIDEAYALNPGGNGNGNSSQDPYRSAVIDTIVEQVQGVPGEDRAGTKDAAMMVHSMHLL